MKSPKTKQELPTSVDQSQDIVGDEMRRNSMERVKGLEPSTCAMATRRSSQLSYTRFFLERS